MKNIFFILVCFAFPAFAFGQIVKTAAVPYTKTSGFTPSLSTSSELRIDTTCSCLYWWDRDNLTWRRFQPGIDIITGGIAPAYTPRDNQSYFAVNADAELWYYDGAAWNQISGAGDDWGTEVVKRDSSLQGSGTVSSVLGIKGYGAASNNQVPSKTTGGIAWITPLTVEVDGSVTNEGSLTVGAGGANSSTIASNTTGSTDVTISGSTTALVTESGSTITVQADTSLIATVNDVNAARNRNDSTWVKTSGSYLNKRITDDVYRTGKTGINQASPTRNLDVLGSARGTLQDRGGAVYNVAAYDIFPNGMDGTENLRKLLDTMYNNGGGVLQFNEGAYRITGTLTPKWSNQCVGKSPPLKIVGAGAFMQGQLGYNAVAGGTILRFVSTDSIMWDMRGVGLTEFTGLSFVDSTTGGAKMFIRTTLNTVHVHDCSFFGDKFAHNAEDIAIVCGSTLEGTGDGLCADGDTSLNSAFQGYGTVIRDNFFNAIRHGVLLRQFANSVHVLNNTWWNNCGGDSAIEIGLANETNASVSNLISGNLIEMPSYKYGIRARGAPKTIIVENQFYDHGDSLRYDVYLDNASEYCYVELPFQYATDTSKILYDGSQSATVLITEQNYPSRFTQGLKVKKHFQYTDSGNNSGVWITTGGKRFYQTWASDGVNQYVENSPPTAVHLNSFRDAGSGSIIWRMPGTNQFLDADGSLRIRVTGTDLYFRTNGDENHLISNGVFYGGMSSTTTPFKLGQSDFLYWSDGASPTNGSSAGFTSTAAQVMRTVNGSGTNAQHEALDFKATGTGANQLPVGTSGQEPGASNGLIRYNSTTSRARTVVGGSWANIVTSADVPSETGIAAGAIKAFYTTRALPTAVNSIIFIGLVNPGSSGNGVAHGRLTVIADGSGVAVSKSYDLPLAYNATGGQWETLLPISNTGVYSSTQDFEVEIRSAANKDSLRIRRTVGTTAATARIALEFNAFDAGLTFTEISTTGTSAAAAGGTYRLQSIYQSKNRTGVNQTAPTAALDVIGTGASSATDALRVANSSGTRQLTVRNDGRTGVGNVSSPNRTLEVGGEVRITDLTTDAPTQIVGADGDGDLGAVALSGELAITAGTLGTNFSTTISPAQLTAGTTNNWNPTGLSTAGVVRVDGDDKFEVITGITAPAFNKRLSLWNVGSNAFLLPKESTGSSAANRFNFEAVVFPGKCVEIVYDVTTARWRLLSTADIYNDVEHLYLNKKFTAPVSLTSADYDFWNIVSEASATATLPVSGRWRGAAVNTGASATGLGHVSSKEHFFENNNTAGTATWAYLRAVVQTPANLSDGTNDYTIRVGFNAQAGGGGATDGMYFNYNHGLSSGQWACHTTNAGNTQSNSSGVSVAASTVYVLEVIFRPNLLVEYFINGSRVATNDTFIPTGDDMLVTAEVEKSVGTSQRDLVIYTMHTGVALVK